MAFENTDAATKEIAIKSFNAIVMALTNDFMVGKLSADEQGFSFEYHFDTPHHVAVGTYYGEQFRVDVVGKAQKLLGDAPLDWMLQPLVAELSENPGDASIAKFGASEFGKSYLNKTGEPSDFSSAALAKLDKAIAACMKNLTAQKRLWPWLLFLASSPLIALSLFWTGLFDDYYPSFYRMDNRAEQIIGSLVPYFGAFVIFIAFQKSAVRRNLVGLGLPDIKTGAPGKSLACFLLGAILYVGGFVVAMSPGALPYQEALGIDTSQDHRSSLLWTDQERLGEWQVQVFERNGWRTTRALAVSVGEDGFDYVALTCGETIGVQLPLSSVGGSVSNGDFRVIVDGQIIASQGVFKRWTIPVFLEITLPKGAASAIRRGQQMTVCQLDQNGACQTTGIVSLTGSNDLLDLICPK